MDHKECGHGIGVECSPVKKKVPGSFHFPVLTEFFFSLHTAFRTTVLWDTYRSPIVWLLLSYLFPLLLSLSFISWAVCWHHTNNLTSNFFSLERLWTSKLTNVHSNHNPPPLGTKPLVRNWGSLSPVEARTYASQGGHATLLRDLIKV